jgi:phosphoribosylamine--glycine ligase
VVEQHDADVTSAEAVTGLAMDRRRPGGRRPGGAAVLGVADAARRRGHRLLRAHQGRRLDRGVLKAFAKDVMSAAGCGTALCETVDNPAHLDAALDLAWLAQASPPGW